MLNKLRGMDAAGSIPPLSPHPFETLPGIGFVGIDPQYRGNVFHTLPLAPLVLAKVPAACS
jgi:hypothetical protein